MCCVSITQPGLASWNQHAGDVGNSRYVPGTQDVTTFAHAWSHTITHGNGSTSQLYPFGVAVDSQRVFYSSGAQTTTQANASVNALNLLTGAPEWSSVVPVRIGHNKLSEPTVSNGVVYVNRSGYDTTGDDRVDEVDQPSLYRIDAQSGTVLSRTRTLGQHGSVFRPKRFGGVLVSQGGAYGGAYGFSPGTGDIYWHDRTVLRESNHEPQRLLAGTNSFAVDRVDKISLLTGAVTGTYTHPDGLNLWNPAFSDGAVYYSASQQTDRRVTKLDQQTGARLWDYTLPEDISVHTLGASPDRIVAVSNTGLMVLDAQTGQLESSIDGFRGVQHELAITDTHAFFLTSFASGVHAYDFERQRVTWSTPVVGEIAVSDGMLLISSRQHINAFRIAAPDPISVTPTFDAQAQWNGATFDVVDGGTSMVTNRVDIIDLDQRMVMEFGLEGVPDNAVVRSASLTLDIASFTSTVNNGEQTFGNIELYAYTGDGVMSDDDATAGLTMIGASQPITALGEVTIDLDPVMLTLMVQDGAGFLGMVGITGPGDEQYVANTTEGNALISSWLAPELTVAFDWLAQGDLNGDGAVTNADISALVLALTDPEAYSEAHPFIDPDLIADFTGDGTMTNADIAGFVALLTGGSTPEAAALEQQILAQVNAVPEPSSLPLLAISGLLLSRRRRA